jgi:hypothetical protein
MMKKLRLPVNRLSGLLLALGLASRSDVVIAQTPTMDVFPRDAAGGTIMELADFVALVVPAKGMDELEWDYLVDGPIVWMSDGVDLEGNDAIRRGLVRLTINGKKPRVLRQRYEEQAWSFDLRTSGNMKWGPKSMRLEVECFGTLRSNCEFSAKDLRQRADIDAQLLCSTRTNLIHEVYRLSVKDKPPLLMLYAWDGGSGGGSSWLEFYSLQKQKALCDDARP